jgi:hypothetical protein
MIAVGFGVKHTNEAISLSMKKAMMVVVRSRETSLCKVHPCSSNIPPPRAMKHHDANAWVILTGIFAYVLQDPSLSTAYLIVDTGWGATLSSASQPFWVAQSGLSSDGSGVASSFKYFQYYQVLSMQSD